jgi:hypothetical protein
MGDLAEKKPGILGLEKDKFVEAWICLGGFWHGWSLQSYYGGGKRKAAREKMAAYAVACQSARDSQLIPCKPVLPAPLRGRSPSSTSTAL